MAETEELKARPPRQRKDPPAPEAEGEEIYAVSPVPRRPPKPVRKRIHRDDEEDWEEEEDDWRSSDGGISTLIPYTNPKALIAYYLGIFGLIPCLGAILSPAALVLGILGLRYLKKIPGATGMAACVFVIVLGS